jgi:hypothetical protein
MCTLSKRKKESKKTVKRGALGSLNALHTTGLPPVNDPSSTRVYRRSRHPGVTPVLLPSQAVFFRNYAPFSIFLFDFSDLFMSRRAVFSVGPTLETRNPDTADTDTEQLRRRLETPAAISHSGLFQQHRLLTKDEVVFSKSRNPARPGVGRRRLRASGVCIGV